MKGKGQMLDLRKRTTYVVALPAATARRAEHFGYHLIKLFLGMSGIHDRLYSIVGRHPCAHLEGVVFQTDIRTRVALRNLRLVRKAWQYTQRSRGHIHQAPSVGTPALWGGTLGVFQVFFSSTRRPCLFAECLGVGRRTCCAKICCWGVS